MQVYEIQIADDFQRQQPQVPRSVSKKLLNAYQRLRTSPHDGPSIKKLRGWKELYRLRMGDYRAIYRIEQARRAVTLLYIGPRKDVYEQLGHDPNREAPCARVIANEQAHRLLEKQPAPREPVRTDGDSRSTRPEPAGVDLPLPSRFGSVLEQLGITGDARSALLACNTESQLLECEVPHALLGRVLDALWPQSIERIVDGPKRVVDSPEGLKAAADGTRPLASFLLALDDSQKPVVNRFGRRPHGPWIVKGGPGTGKSIVALYCLRNLVRPDQSVLPLESEPLRVLFTTYTKALVNVSTDLLRELRVSTPQPAEVVNVDALARRHAVSDWANPIYRALDTEWTDVVETVLPQCRRKIDGFALSIDDSEFLHTEMNQVIIGNEINSPGIYESFERVGRGTRLGPKQRRQVWTFAGAAWKELKNRKRCLPGHLFTDATKSARAIYDYVFIDEAQDLLPAAIRMCMRLAKDTRNVFLTADRNQSIYNAGFSWRQVENSLDFRGRSTILRRNYRTTREIMDAIRPLLAGDGQIDEDTRDADLVRRGAPPELRWGSSANEVEIVQRWLTGVVAEEQVGFAHTAVLCPTNPDCDRVAGGLNRLGLTAKAMKKGSVDLSYGGVKVMTMHNAKGLEFPVVAVVGLADGRMPWTGADVPENQEETDKLRRTFFVACSRAMRRLLVVADRAKPSSFLENLDNARWTIR